MATGVNAVETVTGKLIEIRPGRRISPAVAKGTGTTAFLCHGGGGNKDQWRNQSTALTAAGGALGDHQVRIGLGRWPLLRRLIHREAMCNTTHNA